MVWISKIASLLLLVTMVGCSPSAEWSDSDGSTESQGDGDSSSDVVADEESQMVSIAALKSLYLGATTRITTPISISGVVVANDIMGEFEDVIVLDDGLDAIEIAISSDSLCESYPLDYSVVCRCEDLYLGSDYGVLRLGDKPSATDETVGVIEGSLLSKLYLTGECNGLIPEVVEIADLTDRMTSRFLQFEYVRFKESDTTFCEVDSESGNTLSTTHTLVDRYGNELTLFVLYSATYARQSLPTGWFALNVIMGSSSARQTDYGIFQY